MTAGWIVLGLLIYYAWAQKQAVHETPQVLVPRGREPAAPTGYSVLVPVANPDNVGTLLDMACPIAREHNGRVVVLSVVNVPRQLPIHEGLRFVHHQDRLFKVARQHAAEYGVPIDSEVIIAHHIYDGILSAARRLHPDLLLMGWKGYTNTRERIFGEVSDHVIRHAPCDLMLLKIGRRSERRRVLLPTAGGPDASQEERYQADVWIDKTLERFADGGGVEKLLIESSSVAGGIAKASRDYDLVVLGAAKEPLFRRVLVGDIAAKVVRYSPANVMLVKRYEGRLRSVLKRLLG